VSELASLWQDQPILNLHDHLFVGMQVGASETPKEIVIGYAHSFVEIWTWDLKKMVCFRGCEEHCIL